MAQSKVEILITAKDLASKQMERLSESMKQTQQATEQLGGRLNANQKAWDNHAVATGQISSSLDDFINRQHGVADATDSASNATRSFSDRLKTSFKSSLEGATATSQKFAKGLGIAGAAAGAALAGGLTLAGKAAWDQVYAVEQATVALSAYEKDGEKVNKVLNDLVGYARSDMGVLFQRQDLFAAAQGLRVMGAETDNLSGYVQIMSRSVGLGLTSFDELGRVIGRVGSTGRLTGIDFDMLTKAGFQLDDSLRNTNVTWEELFENLDNGIPADAMAGQANTIQGLTIRMQSAFRDLGLEILGVDKETSKFIEGGLGDRLVNGIGTLTNMLRAAAPTVRTLALTFTDMVSAFAGFIDRHGDKIAGFFRTLADNWQILVGVLVGALTPAIIAAGVAFVAMLPAIGAAVVAMAPFIAAGAAVGLLAKVIMDNWEPISGFFTNLWSSITGAIDKAMAFIGEKIEWFKENWAMAIGFAIAFVATLPIQLPILMAKATLAMINVLRNVNWGEAFNRIISALNNTISRLWNGWTSIWDRMVNFVRNINWGAILSGIGQAVLNGIKGAVSAIPGATQAMSALGIPGFAAGTNFAPGGLAVVGERGPELVNLPRGSQVIPNHRIGEYTANQGTTVNIGTVVNQSNMDADAFLSGLSWYLR